MRPNFITKEDIERWDDNINNDPNVPEGFADIPLQREVCYVGLWLFEQLSELGCEEENIFKLQHIVGHLSRDNDPWDVAMYTVEQFKEKISPIINESLN